jgi:hypothetical protein
VPFQDPIDEARSLHDLRRFDPTASNDWTADSNTTSASVSPSRLARSVAKSTEAPRKMTSLTEQQALKALKNKGFGQMMKKLVANNVPA